MKIFEESLSQLRDIERDFAQKFRERMIVQEILPDGRIVDFDGGARGKTP